MSLSRARVFRVPVPLLGRIALALGRDAGEALFADGLLVKTDLHATIIRPKCPPEERHLGSGLVTVTLVNTLVSDAVTGTTVIPTLYRFRYMDSGTGTAAATETDTALQTPAGPARVASALSNFQTASGSNHAAILQYQGTISYTGTTLVTEFGLFDAATTGNLADRRVFSVLSMSSGDAIQFTYQLTLGSGG